MNPRVLAVAAGCAVLAIGAALMLGTRRSTTPAHESTTAAAPAAAPAERPPAPAAAPRGDPAAAASAPRAARPAEESAGVVAAPAAPPGVGTLRIDTDVPGAQVFIDRQFIGTAPVTAQNLTPGTHQLNVSAEGFEGVARSIDVEPGPRELSIRFRDVRLDARLAVVHKHRMGSCTGELVATPDGLRYDTDDADDRFAVALADIETFQVDYNEKNLKVKVRKGRQYNFTDPDGSADRLFVFHRDVEKVRQRLAGGDRPSGE